MDSEYKLIIPYSDSNQYGSKPGISGIQENELSIIKDYERKLDNALNLSWAPKNSLTMDDFDDISGIRECFDDRRYLRENPPIIEAINKGLVSSAWDHWLQYGRIQRRFAKFDLPFEVLNDRNFNKDIFIFLDRNELHQLDNLAQIYLRSKTTLDFADFNMEAPPSYIIVSNLRDQMIAAKMAPPETSIICLRPVD